MDKKIHLLFLLGLLLACIAPELSAQGCVAVRPMGGCGGSTTNSIILGKKEWQVGANYRYFKSFRHFRSDSEEEERVENGTEVINHAHSIDLGLSYGISNRLSVTAALPLIYYDRSSLYEHYGNSTAANPEQKRFNTGAQGIGDLRLSATYWLFNPENHHNYNLAAGLGIKLPTGNENVQDEFHRRKSTDGSDTVIIKAVDQSIQLGDGGVGISLELQGYLRAGELGAFYLNGFYLSNPRETNNTVNRTLTASSTKSDSITAFHSVADQFMVRFGFNMIVSSRHNLGVNLGMRMEGVPVRDVIGGDWGFRRPGYVVALEPGLSWQKGNFLFSANVPWALYRNRTRSVADIAGGINPATGLPRQGDAAFADYAINVGVAYRFGGEKMAHGSMDNVPKIKDVNH